mgnify:CR=1 FL=1
MSGPLTKTLTVDAVNTLLADYLTSVFQWEAGRVVVEWCVAQCKELMAHGVPSIHFYSIGAVDSIKEVAKIIY